MTSSRSSSSAIVAILALWISTATICHAFTTTNSIVTPITHRIQPSRHSIDLWDSDSPDQEESGEKKLSLEEKMKSWEASEEEIKAASLGGVVPQPRGEDRSGAFDVGLYIAFPIMVITGLIFALFPFIMGSLDVDSVGPPPTV